MFSQKVTINYVDGTAKEVVLDQWSLGQWGIFSSKQGWAMDVEKPGILGITMLRFQAYAQQHRDVNGAKPSFDIWDRTVAEVTPEEEPQEVTPTSAAT